MRNELDELYRMMSASNYCWNECVFGFPRNSWRDSADVMSSGKVLSLLLSIHVDSYMYIV